MGKKNQTLEIRKLRQIHAFQWEFLRRNTGYRLDYDNLINQFGNWFREKGYWYEDDNWTDEEFVFFRNRVCPILTKICMKWQITEPVPPDWTFDVHGLHRCGRSVRVYIPTDCTADRAGHLWNQGPVELINNLPRPQPGEPVRSAVRWLSAKPRRKTTAKEKKDNPRFLHLKLDVTRTRAELIQQTLDSVQFHRKRYAQQLKVMERKPEKRRRLDQYEVYLKVWDLRREGLHFHQIAKRLYPVEYESYPKPNNPIIQRVTDHHSRAKQLIEGGYKELA
jgi:hypothetical protein